MTQISPERIIRRETGELYRGRPIVVEVQVNGLVLRTKKSRKGFLLPYRAAFDCAMKLEARRVMEERAKEKKARKRQPKYSAARKVSRGLLRVGV